MTFICAGFKRVRQRLGTIYGNGTLDAQATGINAAGPNGDGSGDSTITLPASPSTNQTITINNTGTGTVTVDGNGNNIGASATTTVAAGTSTWFIWGGYSWGAVSGSSCETVTLPATYDFGTTTQGPAETAYTVPEDTVTYETIGYTQCGGLFRKIITTTYDGRSVADQWKADATWYSQNDAEWTPSYSESQTSYGASQGAALTAAAALCSPPAEFLKPAFPTVNALYDSFVSPNFRYGVYLSGVWQYDSDSFGTLQSADYTQLSLYYLDTQIVWTYDIV